MPLPELVFVHGWAFDTGFWDALAVQLPQFQQTRLNLGFFGNATTETKFDCGPPGILVGHSLGFMHGLNLRQDWKGWIAINSFPQFISTSPGKGCVSAAALRDMRMRLQVAPAKTLNDFYRLICAEPCDGMPNLRRLRDGLDELQDGDIQGILEELNMPGLALAGRKDPLVPVAVSGEFENLIMHNNGGHAAENRSCLVRSDDYEFRHGEFQLMRNIARKTVAENFDSAAASYDQAAGVQAQIADYLVGRARKGLTQPPQNILDIGCGTGLVAQAAARQWPQGQIAAIDGSPAMLNEAWRKLPSLRVIIGDIGTIQPEPRFDLVLSSMALHWMPDAAATLVRWQKGLKPKGKLFTALLVEGSFKEWRDLCASEDVADGLWILPPADFADGIATETEIQTLTVDYPSARDFLLRLKATGAATPNPRHRPLDAAAMRSLLDGAPQPFTVTYRVLYIEAPSSDSI